MNKPSLLPLKGFRDFYPPAMAFQSWFYKNIKEVSESFGFQEYDGPLLESLDLYAAKSGEELVKKQAFTLLDKSGGTLTLRPEMTPSLARMIAQKEDSLTFPVKWFTYGRRFRYEQPQKGRGREFFQWDLDILGLDNPEADAEVISLAASLYKRLGLTSDEVKIKVNDRQYLQEKLIKVGISPEKATSIFRIIDKKQKVDTTTFNEMLKDEGLSSSQTEGILKVLSDKKGVSSSEWLTKIFNVISKSDLSDYVEFDPTIVRGLDYYTKTVFEGWDVGGNFRSIWGGGRYNNLTSDVGSKKAIPGVGFAMGDMVIEEILKLKSKYPKLKTVNTKFLVTVFSPELYEKSLEVASILRDMGNNTEIYLDASAKLNKQFKYADRKSIPYTIVIGPEEVEKGTVVLKNMATGTQRPIFITQLSKEKI